MRLSNVCFLRLSCSRPAVFGTASYHLKHKVEPPNKMWFYSATVPRERALGGNRHLSCISVAHAGPSSINRTCVPTDRKPLSCHDRDGSYVSPLTFSANHSHCKTSAIKHWPAGDKEPSHLAGGAPYVTSPSYKQSVMALLPHTSPSYLSPCGPRSGETTCPDNDKTIWGIECNDCPNETGHCCWSNNKLCAT